MEAQWNKYNRIARPFEALGVKDATAYRFWQAATIEKNREKRPGLNWRNPFEADPDGAIAQVIGGRWVVPCTSCKNDALYDPEWQLACCGECGAVFSNIAPPEDRVLAELVLMARAVDSSRNWNPATETLAMLIQENREHGEPDGVGDDIAAPRLAALAGEQVQEIAAVALPTRSLVFVEDDPVPHIVHGDVIVSAEQDAEMFPAVESPISEDIATAVVLAMVATKGGAK